MTEIEQEKVSKKDSRLYSDVYRFIQDVYPDFYSNCWLGQGKFDKYVDNIIDSIVEELKNETA